MVEFIGGFIILLILFSIIIILLLKWRRDYRKTKKPLILYDKRTKYWLPIFIILSAMLIKMIFFTDYSRSIQYESDPWLPWWGWYS